MLYPSILISLLPFTYAASSCLRFADANSINQLFSDGGPGTKVLLCPSKTYRLSTTIVFTAADQELATFGYPTGSERATVLVTASNIATAIQGDCRRCARVAVRHLVVDGNRQKLGRMVAHEPGGLVILGGNEAQTISHCLIQNPRGFTAVHIREGDKLSCTGALIESNTIGPAGEEYDPMYDGEDPETSPHGRPLSDGLTIACRDSTVRENTFIDNTNTGIVIYCSPGTMVTQNLISTRAHSAMAGILMVDSAPFDGDYKGLIVKQNVIDAAVKPIRVGIGLGAAVLSDDTQTILKGGTVSSNEIKGNFMGYGITAAGLDGWIVQENRDTAKHEGKRSNRCFDDFENPQPMPYLWDEKSVINSVFQSDFVDGEFQYGRSCVGDANNSRLHRRIRRCRGRGGFGIPTRRARTRTTGTLHWFFTDG
jgi:parallel beta-helix repeat protein